MKGYVQNKGNERSPLFKYPQKPLIRKSNKTRHPVAEKLDLVTLKRFPIQQL